jgi:hypothetical protein
MTFYFIKCNYFCSYFLHKNEKLFTFAMCLVTLRHFLSDQTEINVIPILREHDILKLFSVILT